MFDPKQRPSAPGTPDPSSTVSYGTGSAAGAAAGQRAAPQPPPPQGQAPAAKGTLSPRTVELVQRTWAQVVPISDAAATLFYDRLFEMDPSVRSLFKNDMAQQKKKLMQTLSVAVDGLVNPQRLIPVLEQLGARHAGYMVQDHHYGLVGEALLWTLREGLGDGFTPEVETAWREVYGVVAGVMKRAASGAKSASAPPPPIPNRTEPPPPAAPRAAPPAPPPATYSSPPVPSAAPPVPAVAAPRPAQPSPPSQTSVPTVKGPLSPRTLELVQRSWAQVMPISDAAATLFYDRLFEMDPSVRPLFKNDMAQQKKKLMQTLSVAVDGLTNPTRLIPVLEQLGARHAGYMVQDHHYDLVGEALLWTLREGLGDGFTPETEMAWKEVYGLVAGVMKKAAAAATPQKPAASALEAPAEPPPVPEEFDVQVASPMPSVERKTTGDDTIPYHMLVQAPMGSMQPYSPAAPALSDAPRSAPAAPYSSAISIPVNVPREVTFNVNLHLKLDAESALRALESRTPAPAPAPAAAPAPAPRATPAREPPAPEPAAPQKAPTSPALLVALCVLVSVSTVIALGPLGQATASLTLQDLARFAVPVFTVAALAVGYLWGRGRSPERRR
jgi:hemoglobin-like flavoprotein